MFEKKKALKAKKKKAKIGPDIDLGKYPVRSPGHKGLSCLALLPKEYRKQSLRVGIDPKEKGRAGSFFQLDNSVIYSKAAQKGLEVMGTAEALKKYKWLRDYWWKAVSVDEDKYTAHAELSRTGGYFLRALPKTKTTFPLQACLFMGKEGIAQNVHNIIIAEEGSQLHIINGCTVAPSVRSGLHVGVSEFYVKRNATITFTMIHNWAEGMEVRPRTGAVIGDNGLFMSNYLCLKPVKNLQAYPTAYCAGKGARVRYHTLIYGEKNSFIDIGARAFLRGEGAKAEITTRVIAKGNSTINARGHLIGEVPGVKAHLECRGLILSKRAKIHAIPELESKSDDADLSHEAAIGKIEEEQVQYLMARGLGEEEATSLLIRGFLDVEIPGLPRPLKKEIKKMVEATTGAGI